MAINPSILQIETSHLLGLQGPQQTLACSIVIICSIDIIQIKLKISSHFCGLLRTHEFWIQKTLPFFNYKKICFLFAGSNIVFSKRKGSSVFLFHGVQCINRFALAYEGRLLLFLCSRPLELGRNSPPPPSRFWHE